MESKNDELMQHALGLVAPGTPLRDAIDSIQAARTGALLIVGDLDAVGPLCDGGFGLDTPFEPERLFELAKMDGAIVLDEECRSIRKANVHLVPDSSLPTSETGIRHRTADRVSQQTDALVIAISQRRLRLTLYRSGKKLILDHLEAILAKASQALQTLQRYRTALDDATVRLDGLEFEDSVTLNAVVTVAQRSVSAIRVARELSRYIAELGTEGRLVRMQADELTLSVDRDLTTLLRDYSTDSRPRKIAAIKAKMIELPPEQLLEGTVVAQLMGHAPSPDALESHVRPRGYRLLHKIPLLPAPVINRIIERFGDLPSLLESSEEDLDDVDGVGRRRALAITEGLRRIRDHGAF